VSQKSHFHFFEWLRKKANFNNFLACNIKKKLDVNDYSFAHLTIIMLLHYLVKCRSPTTIIKIGQRLTKLFKNKSGFLLGHTVERICSIITL